MVARARGHSAALRGGGGTTPFTAFSSTVRRGSKSGQLPVSISQSKSAGSQFVANSTRGSARRFSYTLPSSVRARKRRSPGLSDGSTRPIGTLDTM